MRSGVATRFEPQWTRPQMGARVLDGCAQRRCGDGHVTRPSQTSVYYLYGLLLSMHDTGGPPSGSTKWRGQAYMTSDI